MAEIKKKSTMKKPAVKKASTAAKPAAAKKVAVAKKPAAKKPAASKPNKIGAEERYRMVEVAAYFMAERNKFAGSPVGYWTVAEVQIKKMLG